MTKRTVLILALGAVFLLAIWGVVESSSPPPAQPGTTAPAEPSASAAEAPVPIVSPVPATSVPLPIRRPPSSVAELGVLTDRPEAALTALLDRAALASKLGPDLCGDPAACDAVRKVLRDGTMTTLDVVDSSTWNLPRADLDAGARGLSAAERASAGKLPRVVVVRVATPTSRQALALRTALAVTALVAREVGGVVWDQLLARFEGARTFASHAVTAPLEASAFRRDRVEVLYEPKGERAVRVLTSGLSRWGQPDVEAEAVPLPVSSRMGEVVLAAAEALADGAATQPLVLSLDDLARARGQAYPLDAGLPAPSPVEVELVTALPENGDPNDFMARIVPGAGESTLGAMDLAGRFFGPFLAASPGEDVLAPRRAKAQERLASALGRWEAQKAKGATLLVLLPFAIPGDAGVESMWLEVTRADARTVTGKVMDEPLGATDVKRGDEVTRPRSQVEDLELRGATP